MVRNTLCCNTDTRPDKTQRSGFGAHQNDAGNTDARHENDAATLTPETKGHDAQHFRYATE